GLAPWRDGALVQRFVGVRHNQRRIDLELFAQAVASRTGAEGGVERKQARLDLGDREARNGTSELRREGDAACSPACGGGRDELRDGDAVGEAKRRLETLGQALFEPRLDDDAVHDDVNVVLQLLVQLRW